jgi:predicted dehydrogenase
MCSFVSDLPTPAHQLLCLQNKKHVLVEKPIGLNVQEAKAMIDEASKQGVFLLEGMWTRFFPATKKV